MELEETPWQTAIREVREEVCVDVSVVHLVGVYFLSGGPGGHRPALLDFVFRCRIIDGRPTMPATGEIAEVGWFDPAVLPEPMTNVAPAAIADGVAGVKGAWREVERRN